MEQAVDGYADLLTDARWAATARAALAEVGRILHLLAAVDAEFAEARRPLQERIEELLREEEIEPEGPTEL